jgi:hypothetical protein
VDRLDLLPFYARFLATIHKVFPELVIQNVLHKLLAKFREITEKTLEPPKQVQVPEDAQKVTLRIGAKLHLCSYLAELVSIFIYYYFIWDNFFQKKPRI